METLRKEHLGSSIGFMFFMTIVVMYAAIWSLDAAVFSTKLLVSHMSVHIWVAGIIWFIGAVLSWLLYKRSTFASSWILCLSVSAGIFSILIWFSQPYGVLAFLLPLFIACILFDLWQQSMLFIMIMAGAIFLNLSLLTDGVLIYDVLLPLFILLVLSVFFFVTFYSLHLTFNWYENNYILEKGNRQIIRENEIKLTHLIEALKIQQEYLKTNNELLIIAHDEAEIAKKAKQVFVENVSHELLSPLNMIIGFSETMLNTPSVYGEVNWTPELRNDVVDIYNNSKHLKSLIDDVLRLASMENKYFTVNTDDINLDDVIDEAVQTYRESFNKKGLFINTNRESHELMVRADALRVKQVVLNLLSNALKATSKGGVTVFIHQLGDMACVSIEDTGKGIPEYAMDKVFEPFYQVDKSSSLQDANTGLGLFIAKKLIEHNGGEIQISSLIGVGTTISFTLPLVELKN